MAEMETKTEAAVEQEAHTAQDTKFCKHCGNRIAAAAVVCPQCGCQVEEIKSAETPQINITNTNMNTNANIMGAMGRMKNKWVAFFLCLFLGGIGAHKFYEGKTGLGILYLFTMGLFFIGWLVDLITLLFKPNPYYV